MSKVAIPALGQDLLAKYSPSVGHSPYLLYVDSETKAYEVKDNPGYSAESHAGMVAAKAIWEDGAEVVLGHQFGPHPAEFFEKKGIEVYTVTLTGTVEEILNAYLNNKFHKLTTEDTANHQCGHHH